LLIYFIFSKLDNTVTQFYINKPLLLLPLLPLSQ